MRITQFFLLAMGLCVGCSGMSHNSSPPAALEQVSEIRYVMGTLLDITIFVPSPSEGREILNDTFAIAERLNSVLSTWKPESPVIVFNRDTSTGLRPVDPDLFALVARSQELSDKTDHAFTIGVRPLVEMWEAAAKTGVPPSPSAIARVKTLISPSNINTSPPSNLGKSYPAVMIETGGIGKGYAVDAMSTFLKSRGVRHAFINFGRSSIAAIGTPPGAKGWRMELALSEGSSDGSVELRDETLSVSRARGTPFVINGTAYAHIFDPRTAMPVKTSRGAAVRGPSATDGEAFVKYLVIRGAPSTRILRQWGDVGWMVKNGDRVESSKGFDSGHAQSGGPVS